jgi:catechol 2,3-dioxygenase-like lactoylglutathione lyase family enzyme
MAELAGFRHAALTVANLDASAAWYTAVLGMQEQFREESPTRNAVVFRFPTGDWFIGLVEHVGSAGRSFDPTVQGLDHLAFRVPSQEDMRAWADRLDAHGVAHSGPIPVPPGEILNFTDPDGIALALFWDR